MLKSCVKHDRGLRNVLSSRQLCAPAWAKRPGELTHFSHCFVMVHCTSNPACHKHHDVRPLFPWFAHRCKLVFLAQGCSLDASCPANGKLGFVLVPGSAQVLDRTSAALPLVQCTLTACPYATPGPNLPVRRVDMPSGLEVEAPY